MGGPGFVRRAEKGSHGQPFRLPSRDSGTKHKQFYSLWDVLTSEPIERLPPNSLTKSLFSLCFESRPESPSSLTRGEIRLERATRSLTRVKSQMAFVPALGSHRTAPRTLARQQELMGTTERAPAKLHPVTEDLDNPKASIRLFLATRTQGKSNLSRRLSVPTSGIRLEIWPISRMRSAADFMAPSRVTVRVRTGSSGSTGISA